MFDQLKSALVPALAQDRAERATWEHSMYDAYAEVSGVRVTEFTDPGFTDFLGVRHACMTIVEARLVAMPSVVGRGETLDEALTAFGEAIRRARLAFSV